MLRKSKSSSICVWLTTLAVMWSALVPALAQANRQADSFLGSVCTSAGLKWVDTTKTGDDNDAGQLSSSTHSERCIWCSAQPAEMDPSPSVAPVLAASFVTVQTHPTALPKAHLIPWAIAPPRAPPSVA